MSKLDIDESLLTGAFSHFSVSIYSEADDVSVHQPTNMPRKTAGASKLGVDRSLIDKGDNDYDETQHSDGKVRVCNPKTSRSL